MKLTINKGAVDQKEYEVTGNVTGTEKQIKWADSIKANKITDIFILLTQPGHSAIEGKIMEYCDTLNAINDAKFWIDNKNNTAKNILKEIKK